MMPAAEAEDHLKLVEHLEDLMIPDEKIQTNTNNNRKKDAAALKLPLNRDSTCEWDVFLKERSLTIKKEEEGNLANSSSSHLLKVPEPNPIVILKWLGEEPPMEQEVVPLPSPSPTTSALLDNKGHARRTKSSESDSSHGSSHSSLPRPVLKWLEEGTPDFLKEEGGVTEPTPPAALPAEEEEEEEEEVVSKDYNNYVKVLADTSDDNDNAASARDSSTSHPLDLSTSSVSRTSSDSTNATEQSSSSQKQQQKKEEPLRLPLNRDSTCEWSLFLQERSMAIKSEEGGLRNSTSSLPTPILKWLEEEEAVPPTTASGGEEEEEGTASSLRQSMHSLPEELPSDMEILMSELSSHSSLPSYNKFWKGPEQQQQQDEETAQKEQHDETARRQEQFLQKEIPYALTNPAGCEEEGDDEWGSIVVPPPQRGSRLLRREEQEDDSSSLPVVPTKKWLASRD